MRRFLLHLPQVFDRVEIGRVRRRLLDGQASRLCVEKLLHGPTCVIPCPVLNHKNMLRSLRQDHEQKSRIAFGIEASRLAPKKKPPRKIVDKSKTYRPCACRW